MADNMLTMYWLPHCSTCQKAASFLEKKGHNVAAFRDIKTDPLGRDEVERLSGLVGGASELFSRRARKYREMQLSERSLTDQEMIQLMSTEYTFIKRPVLVRDRQAIAGFTPKSYDGFLAEV